MTHNSVLQIPRFQLAVITLISYLVGFCFFVVEVSTSEIYFYSSLSSRSPPV